MKVVAFNTFLFIDRTINYKNQLSLINNNLTMDGIKWLIKGLLKIRS